MGSHFSQYLHNIEIYIINFYFYFCNYLLCKFVKGNSQVKLIQMQRKIGKHCTKFRTKLLVENDAESNVYYYHRIMVRCYYLFRGKKKYYIFKPLAEEHPFLVFLSHRPVPHRFLVAFLPTLTFAPARR